MHEGMFVVFNIQKVPGKLLSMASTVAIQDHGFRPSAIIRAARIKAT